ncbi:unnamed protein product [Mesocestoides corti]|uniref:Major facilitator superfamily (MFS) profile domain-containing protein n=1 Tax=Mesocestoides corti TaxID=53468 RepID=A0A3P6HM54_MESCO|nr:unnamed protein product [Mesocestoides corti]
MYAEVLGPSLQTYITVTNSDTELIGIAFSLRELGMFFGSLVGAFVADRFVQWRHLAMSCTLILGAVTIGSVPWCTTVTALSATFFLSGCAHGAMTANGNTLLNSIWLKQSGGPFNFMHSGYGVGAALAPGFLAPFTFELVKTGINGTVSTKKIVRLGIPYAIIAGLCCICAGLFWFFNLCKSRARVAHPMELSKKENGEEESDARSDDDNDVVTPSRCQKLAAHKNILVYIVLPTFFLYAALVGNERVFSKYLFVFANEGPAHISKEDCFLLTSVYWIVFALARIVTVPVSLFIPLPCVFAIQLIGAWAMALGLYLAPPTWTMYLSFTVCFGLFKSPLFPTGLGVISTATTVTGLIAFFVNLGSSVGASMLQAVAGMVLNRMGRQTFPLFVMVSGLVLVFIGAALIATTHFYRIRHGSKSLSAN